MTKECPTRRAIAFATLLAATAPATAQSLPQSGRCDAPAEFIFDSIAFSPTGAQLTYQGQTLPAELRGMRAHDKGFRFSIFANHPIVGTMEIPVFFLPESDGPRMAAVSYDTTQQGRALSYVASYQPTQCTFD